MTSSPYDFAEDRIRRLKRAPVVEAVIQWRARATQEFSLPAINSLLSESLAEYSIREELRAFHVQFAANATDQSNSQLAHHQSDLLMGVKAQTIDGRYVAQFTRDGLVFSRLPQYESWDQFAFEATRVWRIYRDFAQPVEVQRLGVRFINRINGATTGSLSDFLREPPTVPDGMSLHSVFYRSTFAVPGDQFSVQVVKAIEPTSTMQAANSGLLLDIDVFTRTPVSCDDLSIAATLPRMRSLKNRVFFGLLTDRAIEELSGNE